ncbi:MAG: diadenosine tetraphosphate (Ap4A) HIT family hydrolase [Patiriisocius sp.]|jgi:diadenosine tetraphosphate (Ap4A) HIT family hydrolase
MTDKPDLMNIDNARDSLQVENMKKIAKGGFCPFCPEHMQKYHTPPIEKTGKHWYVTPNMYPYENTAHHFLIVTNEHITDSKKLTGGAWAELQEHVNWIMEEHSIAGGTLLMRSGDMANTGSSVLHLHAQFIVGSDPEKAVITRVG